MVPDVKVRCLPPLNMPQRPPRSPEPIGTHSFGGALGTDRLNPTSAYTHPDPFTIGTLNATTINVTDISDFEVQGNITASAGTYHIGSLLVGFERIYVDQLRVAGVGNMTLYANLIPSGATLGVSGTRFDTYFGTEDVNTLTVNTVLNTTNANLVPSSTVTAANGDIGTSTKYYKQGYINELNVDLLNARNLRILVSGDFDADTNTRDMGSEAARWGEGFFENLRVNAIVLDGYLDFTLNTSSAGAGIATLPSAPVGFVTVKVAGTARKIPYYGI